MSLCLCKHKVGKDNRITGNVVSADIEKPYNIVKGSQHMDGSFVFLHFFTDFGKLGGSRFSGVFFLKDPYRFSGKLRALTPDFAD